ncbi:MAG: 2-oxoacid:acceptor oxidoreductase family protein [Candidatus Bipolaricaulota bacterium]|nr:2-oxoacid:acceptor oxidoreductase family protein [Candidatus Bipolaricaulota bacterium]MDW8127240.1 2-oxoacid:acceptor oxidoreductase family protein [Candidatus Bipolaricaulota bacterium]
MKEIRWHGRGGQGAKTVSQILAQINLREGKHVQAFPEYGPERSGAPVRAYNRISDAEIRVHSGVYEPDIVVVIDETLLDSENPTEGLKPNGVLLVNSACSPEEIRARTGFSGRIITVDGDRIAKETGTGFANVPMLGAVVAVLGTDYAVAEAELREALGGRLGAEVLNKNLQAFRAGYEAAKGVTVG